MVCYKATWQYVTPKRGQDLSRTHLLIVTLVRARGLEHGVALNLMSVEHCTDVVQKACQKHCLLNQNAKTPLTPN